MIGKLRGRDHSILAFLSLLLICSASCRPSVEDLARAVAERDVKKVEALLKQGAPPGSAGMENNPLKIAAGNRDTAIIGILLKYGADPNLVVDDDCNSLLQWVLKNRVTNLVGQTIQNGADVNYVNCMDKSTAFPLAINVLPEDDLFQFVDHGLDLLYRDKNNKSYFEQLLIHRKTKILLYFLNYEDAVKDVLADESLSLKLVYYWTGGTRQLADMLISKGLTLNTSLPLLQEAIREVKYDAVEWLLEQGVSPTAEYSDPAGYDILNEGTPLDIVYDTEYRLLHYAGKDYKFEENDPEVIEIRNIEALIQSSIEKQAGRGMTQE